MKEDNVPIVCAFRILQEVYNPLLDFYHQLKINRQDYYLDLLDGYVTNAIVHLEQHDICWFDDVNLSYTINEVSKRVVKIYKKYHLKYKDNMYGAFLKIFVLIKEKMSK